MILSWPQPTVRMSDTERSSRAAWRRSRRTASGWWIGRRVRIPDRIPLRYALVVATEQIAVRLPEELLAVLDDLVARGVYESRAAAVRAGVEAVLELDRRRLADQAIVEGYRRRPPTEVERQAAISSLRDAILEEPW